jgi:GalNAc-alpha-(1->4)-GalNAc-alpha-(1->3)-diNAcBac-PP-undecaprenol alpha-1,4-N-acetyl-D-galactosaminyltransferase
MSRLTAGLARRGHTVTLITLSGTESDFHPLDRGVHRIALSSMGDSRGLLHALVATIRRLLALRRAIREVKPQVVLSFVDATNLLTLLALVGTGIPVVVSERIDPRHHPIGSIRTRLRPYLYRWLASALVVQTNDVVPWAMEFLPRNKIWVIPNAVPNRNDVNMAPFAPPANEPSLIHQRTIVAMGRLNPQKGFDLLLEAWKTVSPRFPDWNLVILGEGPERSRLDMLAREMPRVSLPGKVQHPTTLLRQAGLFVLSSRYEGFPNALLEAMASGLPCLSTKCPSGPSDMIQSGENGLLVEPGCSDALAEGLARLLQDNDLRKSLSRCAASSVERFSPEVVWPLWESCLRGEQPQD